MLWRELHALFRLRVWDAAALGLWIPEHSEPRGSFLLFFPLFFESLNMSCLHVIKIWNYYIKWLQEHVIHDLFCILSFYIYIKIEVFYIYSEKSNLLLKILGDGSFFFWKCCRVFMELILNWEVNSVLCCSWAGRLEQVKSPGLLGHLLPHLWTEVDRWSSGPTWSLTLILWIKLQDRGDTYFGIFPSSGPCSQRISAEKFWSP